MDILKVKRNLNCPVWYQDFQHLRDGAEMIFTGCILRKNPRGRFYYEVILKDKHTNSTLTTSLEKVCEIAEGACEG